MKRLTGLQADIHESFMDQVRERRAGKLKAAEKELFSGEFWTGRRALDLGLIDGLGDLRGIMRERFGERVKLRLVGGGRRLFRWPFAATGQGEPGEWTAGMLAAVEERLLWSRFGL